MEQDDRSIGMLARAVVAEYQRRLLAPLPDPPDGVYLFRRQTSVGQPVNLGFAGPNTCHTTPGGIRVHLKPGCRCPRGRR